MELHTLSINRVGINVRINPNAAQRLMAAGIGVGFRNAEKIAAATEARAVEGEGPANRLRTDGAGHKQADSGTKVWGDQGLILGTLANVVADLEAAGYKLVTTYLQKKEGDRMFQFRLWFSKDETVGKIELSSEAQAEIGTILGQAYEFVHGYHNPDGTATVNPSHRVDGPPKGNVKLVRFTPETGFTAAA